MATPDEIRDWVANATPPKRDTGWYGYCAGLTDRVVAQFTGGTRRYYDSATDARKASGPLNTDPSKCPAGGIHYWSYYGTAGDGSVGDWGHVTIDILGGGTATLSATGNAYEWWGLNAGLISVASQTGRAGMKYLGWSRTYGTAAPLTITTGSAAGGGAVPFPEEDDMPTLQEIFNYQVPKFDAKGNEIGKTTLAAVLGWSDTNNQSVIAATIAGVFSRPTARKGLPTSDPRNGQPTTLDATIAYLDANFAGVKLDPAAITASILAGLPGQVGDVDEATLRQIVTESVEKAQAEALQKLAQGIAQAAS